jgi:hypothetical protein
MGSWYSVGLLLPLEVLSSHSSSIVAVPRLLNRQAFHVSCGGPSNIFYHGCSTKLPLESSQHAQSSLRALTWLPVPVPVISHSSLPVASVLVMCQAAHKRHVWVVAVEIGLARQHGPRLLVGEAPWSTSPRLAACQGAQPCSTAVCWRAPRLRAAWETVGRPPQSGARYRAAAGWQRRQR